MTTVSSNSGSGKNFIVLMSDEHTPSVMGAYGNEVVQTPHLDKLAASGVQFCSAYTPSPICVPARASFATGLSVFEHGCWSSAEPYYGQQQSWMHRLRQRGHDVVSIGKLHFRSAQDDHGFSEEQLPMYLTNDGKGWPQGLLRKPMAMFPAAAELAQNLGPGETSYTQSDRKVTAAAVDWLRQRDAADPTPWVLFVSLVCPHYPLSAPAEFYELYRNVDLLAPFDRDPAIRLRHPVIDEMRRFWNYADYFDVESEVEGLRNYYGLCSFMDDNIGQILAALEASGQADNTEVLYTSDHGDLIGNHGLWCKSFMYEDAVRVPMILKGPGITPEINSTPVSLIDVGATIELAVAGEPKNPCDCWRNQWQSRALHQFIDHPEPDRPVLSEYHDGGSPCGFYMLRCGPWKYIYYSEGNPDLLFNLDHDPHELNNLIDRFPGEAASMRAQLFEICDPEAVNRQAFADQAVMIDKLGGIDVINSMASFNHTPVE